MGILDFLGLGSKTESIQEFVANGALIIDVRTPSEFAGGNIKGSKNIPLSDIKNQIATIKNFQKPIIACCQSGMRSAQATAILKENGIETINGGGWQSLNNKL